MSFSISVERLIDQWRRDGVVDADTAARLKADLERRSSGVSLGSVLAVLGGLLLGAAIIMLVAANWEAMPRLMRIGLMFALIWAGYLGGAWRQSRGDRVFPSALYIVAAAAFGAGIALVGQTYHLSGDVHLGALVWALGVLAAAFLLRAPVLAAFGAGTSVFFLSTYVWDETRGVEALSSYFGVGFLLGLVGVGAALFTRSRHAAHFWAFYFIAWAFMYYNKHSDDAVLALMVAAGAALMLADAFGHEALERLTRFSRPLAAYGLLLALMALGVLQLDRAFSGYYREAVGSDVFYGIVILAGTVGALALCGRHNGGLRAIAYAAFSFEVLYLAFTTVGQMIGTSGFFLAAGVLVLLLAVFVRRMEKRLGGKQEAEARP